MYSRWGKRIIWSKVKELAYQEESCLGKIREVSRAVGSNWDDWE